MNSSFFVSPIPKPILFLRYTWARYSFEKKRTLQAMRLYLEKMQISNSDITEIGVNF